MLAAGGGDVVGDGDRLVALGGGCFWVDVLAVAEDIREFQVVLPGRAAQGAESSEHLDVGPHARHTRPLLVLHRPSAIVEGESAADKRFDSVEACVADVCASAFDRSRISEERWTLPGQERVAERDSLHAETPPLRLVSAIDQCVQSSLLWFRKRGAD